MHVSKIDEKLDHELERVQGAGMREALEGVKGKGSVINFSFDHQLPNNDMKTSY